MGLANPVLDNVILMALEDDRLALNLQDLTACVCADRRHAAILCKITVCVDDAPCARGKSCFGIASLVHKVKMIKITFLSGLFLDIFALRTTLQSGMIHQPAVTWVASDVNTHWSYCSQVFT